MAWLSWGRGGTGPALIMVDLPAHHAQCRVLTLLTALGALRRLGSPDERPNGRGPDPVFVIAGTDVQEQLAYGILQSVIVIDPIDVKGHPERRPYGFAGTGSLASPTAKGAMLAELIRQHRMLVVLDGLEPLQHHGIAKVI